jgi:hypothetical protein
MKNQPRVGATARPVSQQSMPQDDGTGNRADCIYSRTCSEATTSLALMLQVAFSNAP